MGCGRFHIVGIAVLATKLLLHDNTYYVHIYTLLFNEVMELARCNDTMTTFRPRKRYTQPEVNRLWP